MFLYFYFTGKLLILLQASLTVLYYELNNKTMY